MATILGMDLTNKDDTVIPIMRDLYVKTPEALQTLLSELRSIGFQIDNLREDEHRKKNRVSVEMMERNGWSLWFAKLPDIRRGKCGSCNGLISNLGIQSHGHTCELCGAVTYYQIIDGTDIRFSFIDREGVGHGMADIRMKAQRWDTEAGYLYFHPQVEGGLWLKDERAQKYFDTWFEKLPRDVIDMVEENGQQLCKVRYPHPWKYEVSAINPSDIRGHYSNYEIVKLWQGTEYAEFFGDQEFPLPETISIYEAWHYPKHKRSPTIHRTILRSCGQDDDKGWHHKDGSPWFTKGHWENMSRFIRHFTELDADAFDRVWPDFRSSGPGGIDDLAAFCHGKALVRDEPNIGNLLYGFGKAMSGEALTYGDLDAMTRAAGDRSIATTFVSALTGRIPMRKKRGK